MISPSLISLKDFKLTSRDSRLLLSIPELDIRAGEVLGIAGDTASGKSLLSRFLAGEWDRYSGNLSGICLRKRRHGITLNREVHHAALNNSYIRVIHQKRYIPGGFTVRQYLSFSNGRWLFRQPLVTPEQLELLNECAIDPRIRIDTLNDSQKTILCAVGAFTSGCRLVVLDSLLQRLSQHHLNILEQLVQRHRERGDSVLVLSRKIEQLYDWCDRIVILRDQKVAAIESPSNIDRWTLLQLCYGEVNKNPVEHEKEDFRKLLRLNEAVLKELPVMLIYVNQSDEILIMNNTASRFLKQGEDKRSIHLSDILDAHSLQLLEKERRKEELFKADSIDACISGRDVIISLSGFPVRDRGELLGHILVLEDRTEQEKIRRQLIISEKQYSVGILAAGVAHEINNPLEILTNNLDFITLDPDPKEVKEAVQEMKVEIDDIRRIISNLISFTTDPGVGEREPVNLNTTIDHLIRLVRFSAQSREITINFHATRNFHCLIGQTEFRQILTNLIKNSFDAIGSAGIINITLRENYNRGEDSNEILLCFEDNGCGMDEEELSNIFLPFYTRKKATGTNLGLGLSIIYSTLNQAGGSIEAENVSGGGLRFLIRLPETTP